MHNRRNKLKKLVLDGAMALYVTHRLHRKHMANRTLNLWGDLYETDDELRL